MHVSIQKQSVSGSSSSLFMYLDKENEMKEQEAYDAYMNDLIDEYIVDELQDSQLFFNQELNNDDKEKFFKFNEATKAIDENVGDKKEEKENFYLINISPSKDELEHLMKGVNEEIEKIGINKELQNSLEGDKKLEIIRKDLMNQYLRNYTREVMNEYEENFNQKTFVNPNNLPSEHQMKKISKEVKEELKSLKIDRKDANYDEIKDKLMQDKAKEIGKDLSMRKLDGRDVLWFAKVEQNRTYKANDKWVIENKRIQKQINELKNSESKSSAKTQNKIKELESKLNKDRATGDIVKEGMKKGGMQYHIHVVVSKREKNIGNKRFRKTLNPTTNQRGGKQFGKDQQFGFDRKEFFNKTEKVFDRKFQYSRDASKSFEMRNSLSKKNVVISNASKVGSTVYNQLTKDVKQEFRKQVGLTEIDKLNLRKTIGKELGFNIPVKFPKNATQLVFNVAKTIASKVLDAGRGY